MVKDTLSRLFGVRHLHRHHAASSNRLQKKSRRDPGADAHLPGLQHDVALPSIDLKLLLHPIGD
jgi:hypothetical protein